MHRTWLVLLVLCGVVLAGCSMPGDSPQTTDSTGDVTYPAGWGPNGPDNATAALQRASESIDGEDFVERWTAVEATDPGIDEDYLVVVTEVRIDHEQERLLFERQYYLVDTELATAVSESGVEPLDDRRANEVRRTYYNSTGGVQYHRLENRSPRITVSDSNDFASATDQPLPAALVGSAPVFESATYSNATENGDGVGYAISNVSAFHVESGTGHASVGADGLVTGYDITEADPESEESFRYVLEPGDVTVDRPDWVDAGSNTTTNR